MKAADHTSAKCITFYYASDQHRAVTTGFECHV